MYTIFFLNRYPLLPTLEMQNRSFIPMELVDIEPAKVKRITDEQRALLCRYSSIASHIYRKSVQQIRNNPEQQCFEQDPFVMAWNLNIGVEMLTIPARVLPMPEIVYTKQFRINAGSVRDMGAWELKRTRFHKPTDFPKVWGIINLSSLSEEACQEFYYELSSIANDRGITCPAPVIYEKYNAALYSIDQIMTVLKRTMSQNVDCGFFLVILPGDALNRDLIYKHFKKLVT